MRGAGAGNAGMGGSSSMSVAGSGFGAYGGTVGVAPGGEGWEGNFASDGLSTRCAPRTFTEGMARQMRSYQLCDWVRSWRTKEAARRAAEAAPRRRKRRPAEPAPSPWSPGGVDDLRHIPYLAFHARDRPLLTRRSRDARWWVRAATLLNPRLSAGPRERLRHDHHWLVRAMAREEGPRAHPAPGA